MLIITPPHLCITDNCHSNESVVECNIIINNEEKLLYYKTPSEWGRYLTYERADAFLIGVLQYAMKEGHNIEVNAPVSEKLYFNLVNQVIPLLSAGFGHKRIQVKCNQLDNSKLDGDREPFAVGTGCSLGVDSFGSILYHTSSETPHNYKITHLTYFNVGAHGNDIDKATVSYDNDLSMVQEYADFKQMPLVRISSNIGELYKGWNFDHCNQTRNSATVLALQKLFRRYYYASTIDLSHLGLKGDAAYFETALVPYFSTENTELLIGQADSSRVDKIRYIAEFPETYSRLYVCWKEILKNNYNAKNLDTPLLNCSRCEKCRRTMIAIYLLGKENEYRNIFDWDYFHKHVHFMIGYALANKNKKTYYVDLVGFMKQSGFNISLLDRFYQFCLTLYYKIR